MRILYRHGLVFASVVLPIIRSSGNDHIRWHRDRETMTHIVVFTSAPRLPPSRPPGIIPKHLYVKWQGTSHKNKDCLLRLESNWRVLFREGPMPPTSAVLRSPVSRPSSVRLMSLRQVQEQSRYHMVSSTDQLPCALHCIYHRASCSVRLPM